MVFGIVLWVIGPGILTHAIPAAFGLVFAVIVTQAAIRDLFLGKVETDGHARLAPGVPLALAGLVYGLAVWAVLSLFVFPLWAGLVEVGSAACPGLGIESLLGHILFGLVLGIVFGFTVSVERPALSSCEESGERRRRETVSNRSVSSCVRRSSGSIWLARGFDWGHHRASLRRTGISATEIPSSLDCRRNCFLPTR